MTEIRQRQPRQECPAFLAFVRRKACCVCFAPAPSQAAHIRMASAIFDKRPSGIAEKPSDKFCVPLCADCHLNGPEAQHHIGELKFWERAGINPLALADKLWRQFCRREQRNPDKLAEVVARAVRMKKRRKNNGGIRPLKRGVGPGLKSKVSRPIPSRGFPKGPKRKIPSRPSSNREKR